jgi:hypothetical protein
VELPPDDEVTAKALAFGPSTLASALSIFLWHTQLQFVTNPNPVQAPWHFECGPCLQYLLTNSRLLF